MSAKRPVLSRPEQRRADDGALLLRVANGDREALRQLYHAYFRRLNRFLSRFTREPRTIEEIINDTMLIVWRHASGFRGESLPSTWIFGIAYRRALKTLEREAAATRHEREASAAAPRHEDYSLHISTLLGHAELDDWLQAALVQLSPEHRLTLELAYFLGLSCEEIATVSGCPIGTVKTRMFYARERLRELLLTLATPSAERRRGDSR